MAWYDDKSNDGYGPMFFDTEGREHTIVGYAKTHNYVATFEQVYGYRKGSGRIEPYEGHRTRDKSILMPWYQFSTNAQPFKDDGILMPWSSANDWPLKDGGILMPWYQSSPNDHPLKDDGYFSKVHDHVGHRQNYSGVPKNRDAGDPNRHTIYDQSKDLPRDKDGSNLNRFTSYDQSKGLPWNKDGSEPNQFAVYDHNKGLPQNSDARGSSMFSVSDQSNGSPRSRDANDQSWLVAYGQIKGSPRSKDTYELSRFMSSPSKDGYDYSRNNAFSDDEDDVMYENRVYKKEGSKPIDHLKQEDYDKEKHKGHGYSPKKVPYYETPYDTTEKHNGNSYAPSSDTVLVTIPLRKGPYYDPSTHNNNRPVVSDLKPIKTRPDPDFPYENMRNSLVSVVVRQPQYNGSPINNLKPIKTRPDPDFPNEDTRNSPISITVRQPQYNVSPRKYHGYEQGIYNEASPPAKAFAGDQYKGITIDAKEAAKKYKGILFTN